MKKESSIVVIHPISIDFYEDFYIFTRALRELGNMTERDYFAFRKVFDLVTTNLPAPDLLIYVKAPVPVLVKNPKRENDAERARPLAPVTEQLLQYLKKWIPHLPMR